MNLILTELTQEIAKEEMVCESSQLFWKLPRPIDYSLVTVSDAILLFKSRFGKIRIGERFLTLVFVDEEGEMFEMKCLSSMNRFMFSLGIYPIVIQESLLEYRKMHRSKK